MNRKKNGIRNRSMLFTIAFVSALVLQAVFGRTEHVLAASVTITFSTDQEEIRVGDVVEVMMTLTSTDTMGDFEAYLVYDSAVLEFSSAPACINGGGGRLRISDIGASASRQERTYKIRFLAIAQGNCELALYDRPVVYGYTDGIEMSVTCMSKTVTVLPAANASGNSRLATMRILDGTTQLVPLTPKFDPATDTYFSAVSYATTSLILSALPEDSRSTVFVSGEQNLELGSNEITITVTAEDGTSTKYTIYVYREMKQEETVSKEEEPSGPEDEPMIMPGISLETAESTVLVKEYHTYKAAARPENFIVPEGYEQTFLFLDGIQIEAYAKQEEVEEFLLLVLENEAGEVHWYSYDRVEQTLQRVNDERFVVQQVVEADDEVLKQQIEAFQHNQELLLLLAALLSGLSLLLLLLAVWMFLRRKRTR